MLKTILFIVGPTGSGKSKLALMLAQKLNAEIVSADSMQVYKGMNIGTAKPTKMEQKRVPHHLLDSITSRSECSIFRYRKLALNAIQKIEKKGKIPVVVGGSGLYVKALIDGLSPLPGKQIQYRKQLQPLDSLELYERLKKLDPNLAAKVHSNNKKRIIRALEIVETSQMSSSHIKKENHGLNQFGFKPIIFGLNRDRKELYDRIERRVDEMFEEGWIDEVKKLKKTGLSKTAHYAIGYKEILEYLKGTRSLDDMKMEIKKRTRHLAKKQMTWFRKDERVRWRSISGERYAPILCDILGDMKQEIVYVS